MESREGHKYYIVSSVSNNPSKLWSHLNMKRNNFPKPRGTSYGHNVDNVDEFLSHFSSVFQKHIGNFHISDEGIYGQAHLTNSYAKIIVTLKCSA